MKHQFGADGYTFGGDMKTIHKKFRDWFYRYGVTEDFWRSLDDWQKHRIVEVCWRAYQRGRNLK